MQIFGGMRPCSLQIVQGGLKIRFTVCRAYFVLQLCKNIKEATSRKGTTIRRILGSNDLVGLDGNVSAEEQFQNRCLAVFLHIIYFGHRLHEFAEEFLVFRSWFKRLAVV